MSDMTQLDRIEDQFLRCVMCLKKNDYQSHAVVIYGGNSFCLEHFREQYNQNQQISKRVFGQ